MNFEKYNNSSPFAALDLKLEEIENTKTMEQLYQEGTVVKVLAILFSTKGEYGKSAFIVGEDASGTRFTMWLPSHMVEVCEAMVADQEAVSGILAGQCGLKAKTYKDKKGKDRYSVDWCNF